MNVADGTIRPRGEDTRSAIVEAAGVMFERHGYAHCSTRQLAEASGVAEALLYRHFGSKAGLFDLSVRRQFELAVDDFADRWRHTAETEPGDKRVRGFTISLCEFVHDKRKAILALTTFVAFEPETEALHESVRRSMGVLLELINEVVLSDTDGRRRPGLDAELSAPGVLATVLGAFVLDASLYVDRSHAPSAASITEEVVAMVLHGVSDRRRRPDRRLGVRSRRPG